MNGQQLAFLAQRYNSAWRELTVRVTLRQNVVQIYVVACGVVFGFFFTSEPGQQQHLPEYLVSLITILTFVSAVLICVHNRVIAQLLSLLSKCELVAKDQIAASDGVTTFHFVEPNSGGLPRFHKANALRQCLAYAGLFILFNGAAILITVFGEPTAHWFVTLLCFTLLCASIRFAFYIRRIPGEQEG